MLEREHLVARRVHELDVFGQRLAQRARHRLHAAVGDEPATDLLLDQLAQLLQPGVDFLAREALVERRLRRLALVARHAHHPHGEIVEVEHPQRAVEVVGAADGTTRLHPRVLLHREGGEAAQLVAVHVHQRGEEHRRQLLARDAGTGAVAAALALAGHVDLVAAPLGALAVVLARDAVAEQREVDVEDGVERLLVALVLDEGGAQDALEQLAIVDVDELDGAHRVEVLGHRHRQPGRAQLVDEPLEDVEQRRRSGHRHRCYRTASGSGTSSSLRALAMSDWYFSSTWSVSPMTVGSICGRPR